MIWFSRFNHTNKVFLFQYPNLHKLFYALYETTKKEVWVIYMTIFWLVIIFFICLYAHLQAKKNNRRPSEKEKKFAYVLFSMVFYSFHRKLLFI
ncbi:hypothetical protein BAU15_05835 [Enterococcus sp. JM4C]|nr:hypothetical protein BAU15_05835 [Enterococcus sp. JM4C]